MNTIRTFFKKEIFAEVAMPTRASTKVAIICNGAPSVPGKRMLMEFLVKKGYTAIHIRYRGTWESRGVFLKKSLDQDLLDVIDELPNGFTDLWTRKHYKIPRTVLGKVVVVGSSFGGPAVILASRDERVSKAIAFSPVVDWRHQSADEPMPQFTKYMQEAYGEVYRTPASTWKALEAGEIYQAIGHESEIEGNKLMIVHAKDDRIVPIKEVAKFAKKTKAQFVVLSKGGHFSSSTLMTPRIWKRVAKFIKK